MYSLCGHIDADKSTFCYRTDDLSLSPLCRCIDADESVLASVSPIVLTRMAGNLIEVIAAVLDASDYVAEMKISTVAPWLTLFSLIRLYVFTVSLGLNSVE